MTIAVLVLLAFAWYLSLAPRAWGDLIGSIAATPGNVRDEANANIGYGRAAIVEAFWSNFR